MTLPHGRRRPEPPTARRSLKHGMSFAAISFIASALIQLVSSIVTARLYGVEIIGQVALAMAPAAVLALLSTVREQPALVARIAHYPPRHEFVTGLWLATFSFSAALTLALAVPVLLASFALLAGPIGHPELQAPAAVHMAGYLCLANPSWNLDSIFSAYGDGKRLFYVRTQEALITLAAVIALSSHPTYWAPIIGILFAWAICLVQRIVYVRLWIRLRVPTQSIRAGFGELGAVIRFGLKMTPGALANGITTQAGTWALGLVAPVAIVGAWSRAWGISSRFVEVNWRIAEMAFPALVARMAKADVEGADRVYVTAIRYATVFLLAIAAVGAGASESIMRFFGPGFELAAPALALTLIVPWSATIGSLQGALLLALNRPSATSHIALATCAIALCLTATLTPLIGVTGPAIALLASCLIANLFSLRVTGRHFSASYRRYWPYRERIAVVTAALIALSLARLLSEEIAGALGLVVSLIGATAAYGGVLALAGGVSARDREIIALAVQRLSSGRLRRFTATRRAGMSRSRR